MVNCPFPIKMLIANKSHEKNHSQKIHIRIVPLENSITLTRSICAKGCSSQNTQNDKEKKKRFSIQKK